MTKTKTRSIRFALTTALFALPLASIAQAACTGEPLAPTTSGDELLVDKAVCVGAGTYKYKDVHVIDGGTLEFEDAQIDFWANNILVENGGTLRAGTPEAPIGTAGGELVIHLWGEDRIKGNPNANALGVICKSDPKGHCGIPDAVWNSNLTADGHMKPVSQAQSIAASGLTSVYPNAAQDPRIAADYFYAYMPMEFEGGSDEQSRQGYFGDKVLGISYGATVQLFGRKGATYASGGECSPTFPSSSNSSWVRLADSVTKGATSIKIDRPLSFKGGDQIVLTATDYLPGHSETLTVASDVQCATTIPLQDAVAFAHNGIRASLGQTPLTIGPTRSSNVEAVETRAAVGVLSRSIRIVSAGDTRDDDFPAESTHYYNGGHVVIRQGVRELKLQGVEFRQLGQGGTIGRYPVHFHHARHVPDGTFLRDSSINESMTRWVVLHATHNVHLERNVGYKSIGHGFYLEEGTEIDNVLTANLGVFARAAVDNVQNPRKVPGILAAPNTLDSDADQMPFKSDVDHPTVFWIMNGWNDFKDNMAVGAGTCGVCYWLLPGINSGMSKAMKWTSYASMQSSLDRAGMTPLKSFDGNTCSTAMTAFQTVTGTAACHGVQRGGDPSMPKLEPIPNPLAPAMPNEHYYPSLDPGGGRFATRCTADDCSVTPPRCAAGTLDNCMVTVLSRFNTSFNWAPFNFAAIWLRPQWFLVTDSAITDVQQAGLTMVTGGGYTESDVVPGHWALVRKTAFIGATQPDNPFASDGGPFNPAALACATMSNGSRPGSYCLSKDEGISHQVDNFGMYQRMFSVYDGPAFQASNAYLDIHHRKIDDCTPFTDKPNLVGECRPGAGGQSRWLAGTVKGLQRDKASNTCFMPNAAIGWKQPNGFYYPPAFHSQDLYFENVETRHFVLTPFFKEGTLETDYEKLANEYCVWDKTTFNGFTSIDRQTVLNDNDGTLTGFVNTTVVNNDEFFAGPIDSTECKSANSSRTSPYHYVTTTLYPDCARTRTCAVKGQINSGDWNSACTNENCYGVPLLRQDKLPIADKGVTRAIRMMGQDTGQRSSLTVNGGTYYIDTTVSKATQIAENCNPRNGNKVDCAVNEFKAGQTYHVFLIFADEKTEQTYRFFVGKDTDFNPASITLTQVEIGKDPPEFHTVQNLKPHFAGWYANDPESGIVEVRIATADFGQQETLQSFAQARKEHCKPASFCKLSGSQCVGVDPANDAVCSWTQTPPDCPVGGCIGFSFTLPAGFKTASSTQFKPLHPPATCVQRQAPWNTPLVPIAVPFDGCPNTADLHPEDFCAD